MLTFIVITTLFITLLIIFIVVILFFYQRRHLTFQKKFNDLKADFNQNLLTTQLEIQEQTFQNISRELHDNIGLSLTLAKLQLNTIDWKNPVNTQEQVSCSVQVISKAIEDLRYVSKALHTDFITEQGLIKAVDQEIDRIRKTGVFNIVFEITGTTVYMDTQKELVIFRMIQELLNNSIKHSEAEKISLFLHFSSESLRIEVADDGKGFKLYEGGLNPGNGTGLMNLKKRMGLINSTYVINSQPGNGTKVYIDIPY